MAGSVSSLGASISVATGELEERETGDEHARDHLPPLRAHHFRSESPRDFWKRGRGWIICTTRKMTRFPFLAIYP